MGAARERLPEPLPVGERSLEVRAVRPALLELAALHLVHRLHGRARERAERAGVQVGQALEHRQAGAHRYEVDAITASTGG